MIDAQIIVDIKNKLDIVEVIGEFITLRRAGANYVGVCPFHNDSHPSLTVSPVRQTYKCFPCGAGGDVIEFVKEYNRIEFYEALRWCAAKAGVELEDKELTPEQLRRIQHRETLKQAISAASDFYRAHLPEASGYLSARGLDIGADVVKTFRIGYAPAGNILLKELTASGYTLDALMAVNVTARGERGPYDVFRDRIMFPFLDLSGNVIGFSGRYVTPVKTAGKYVNTSETELFTKGHAIFGLYQAKRAIANADNAYLCEGQFDVVSLHAAGVENAIAGSGTALTEEQIKTLLRFTSNITLMYDGDRAGGEAAYKNTDNVLSYGLKTRYVILPAGKDPDDIARENKADTFAWLNKHTVSLVKYFTTVFDAEFSEATRKSALLKKISVLVAKVNDSPLRATYIRELSEAFGFGQDVSEVRKIVQTYRRSVDKKAVSSPGIYGLDELSNTIGDEDACQITGDFDTFIAGYGSSPIIFIQGIPSKGQIQELYSKAKQFYTEDSLTVKKGIESPLLHALSELFKNGITDIVCLSEGREYKFVEACLTAYHNFFFEEEPADKSSFVDRCLELISYSTPTDQKVNAPKYQELLQIKSRAYNDILGIHLSNRKSNRYIASQRSEVGEYDAFDPDDENRPNKYVFENPEYREMYERHGFFPRLNKDGEPVCYMFKTEKGGGHVQVGDFFMQPLLHINDPDPMYNKRVFKINRRYYKKPLFLDVKSVDYLKKSTIEPVLVNLEAVNFTNGTEAQWAEIRTYLSRHFITCTELSTYGNQQQDGDGRRESDNFFAFSNAIFHFVDGVPRIDYANELGVVEHNGENFYLPAFSTIHAERRGSSDAYENIRPLFYKDIPIEKQCSFEHWAQLMDSVYKINDNGKWATLYSIMCAFRSNIHCIDRLFTALFFMGPTSSGKTQIAISVRSLYISRDVSAFNLNSGTDAAMYTLMSAFRDVPVVLDEYNNKDISDGKFQALKSITYDGDGRQKRKGTSGREIEIDKVYSPVIILGQETPQRDDNALMNRVIVCEVPKPIKDRTEEEIALFRELKEIEDHGKVGLSNVLLEVLKLRPIVIKYFKSIQRACIKELTMELPNGGGDMVRIMNTVSLFLAMNKLIEEHTSLKLPFTYAEFFEIAKKKVIQQTEMISRSDKLSQFFKAMDVMISRKVMRPGEYYDIAMPERLTIKLGKGQTKEVILSEGKRVLFLRISNIFTLFCSSSYNTESVTQTTLENNLRSHPAYIGAINARRFRWKEVEQIPDPSSEVDRMMSVVNEKVQMSSCVALDYDVFREVYDIDFETSVNSLSEGKTSLNSESGTAKEDELPF